MKRSFLIQFLILVVLTIWSNVRTDKGFTDDSQENGNAGGIKVELTGDKSHFDSSPTEADPAKGGTFVMSLSAEPEHLNYYTSTSANAKRFLDYIYEPLIDYNYETWQEDRGVLAESWEISEDFKTFTFHLRKNVYWHDGEPLTAHDVLFSLKAILNPFVDDAPLRVYYAKVIDAHIEGDYTFVVSTSDTYFLNFETLGGGHAILPEHIWDPNRLMRQFTIADLMDPTVAKEEPDIKEFADFFNNHPQGRPVGLDAEPIIGSGPWKFDRWITGDYMSLVRNDDYWGADDFYLPGYSADGAYLDKIIIKTISDATASLTALKAGEIEFLPRLRAIQYYEQTITDDFLERFQKVSYVIPSFSYIGWNNDRPFFNDKRVRQAMTMLIDREAYNKYIGYDKDIPTIGPFYRFGSQYNHKIERWPYDPIRAVELIEEAGWIDHDGDGIRDKDGIPFAFTFSISSGSRSSKYLSLMMKEDLRKIGIDVSIRQLEWSVYVENLRDRQFDVVSLLWLSGLETDPYQIWHSDNIGDRGSNYVGFRNAESDSLLEAARYEIDAEKRNAMYHRFQEILHEEQPYTFMFSQRNLAAYSKDLYGVKWVPIRPGYKYYSWWRSSAAAVAPM